MNALRKNLSCSLFAMIVLCIGVPASAQLRAGFSATQQSGCSPLVVYFSDQSAGNPSQWRWELGNGVVSTLQNPSATYFNPGTYTVRLVIRNAAGADSVVKINFVTVHANPVADFTADDTVGCVPFKVQFSEGSAAVSGNISAWQWDFGDGALSSVQNPSHTYISAGNHTVTLRVTNSFGCTKSISKTQYIKTSSGIRAGFTYDASTFCSAPVPVSFSNTSTGSNNNYEWHFGDGTTSTENSPLHTYTKNGSYTVALVAANAEGCKDTLKKFDLINIGGQHADFYIPSTICAGREFTFSNTSSPVPSTAYWNFGDGSSSTSMNPSKKYNSEGNYTIKLVSEFNGCQDSITKAVAVIKKPIPSFTVNNSVYCRAPFTVKFTNTTGGNNIYRWDFGDGIASTEASPVHTYTSTGNFTVKMIVTNSNGCSDTLIKEEFIKIQRPDITINNIYQTGCGPITIRPTASVSSAQPIMSYLWNFGDGTTSNQRSPQHTYTIAGNYDLTLTVVTNTGCADSVKIRWATRVGNKPEVDFTAFPPDVCNANPVQFTDKSTGNVDQWLWQFGDRLSSVEQNPSHVFDGIGQFTVTLIVGNNTCMDTITKPNIVNVRPPLSLFTIQRNCVDKYTRHFTNESVGADTWEWDFGDGTTSKERNPSHTYSKPGTYKMILRVANETCTNLNWAAIKVIDEKPAIVADKNAICKGDKILFSAPSVNAANIQAWFWEFGDGATSSAASSVSHQYLRNGKYTVRLTITDSLGCINAATYDVNVYGSAAAFIVSNAASCLANNNTIFSDASVTDGTHAITKRIWNFGDGVIDSLSKAPFQHIYSKTGEYSVSLTIEDAFGCKDSAVRNNAVIIAQPVAAFYSPDTLSCVEKSIRFVNQSTGYDLQYRWMFGDGINSVSKEPLHQYNNAGIYDIGLVVTDQYGCKDSASKSSYISISLPKAKFTVSDSVGTCPPLMVHFSNEASEYANIYWDFGDGNSSTLENPSHYYTAAGTFYAKQIVTANGGCTDTAIQKIVVKGPSGSFSYTPTIGCKPLTANFTATTQNTTSFVWDFSDGTVLSANGNTAFHTYTTAGDFVPKIILVDKDGCNVPIVGKDTIRVIAVTASFEMSATSFCDKGRIQFKNTSVANDYIADYKWKFGDGSTSNLPNPLHDYTSVGSYAVQLIITTLTGCVDSIALADTIKILEAPVVKIMGNTDACVPASLQFNGAVITGNASELKWEWDFGNGKTSSSITPSTQFYSSAGNYTITAIATALNGCKDTAVFNPTIHSMPSTNAGTDLAICHGTFTQLQATGASKYIWNDAASLSCTDCATPLAAPKDATTYIVTGFTDFGCSKKDSVIVRVHQPFKLNVGNGDTVCAGTRVHLVANGADLYAWYPSTGLEGANSSHATAAPQTSTLYKLIAKDKNNCFTDTASVFIKVWPVPRVNVGADRELIVGESIQLTTINSPDVTSWQWNNTGTLVCATCPNTMAQPKQTTTYVVKVKNDGGCAAQDAVTISVICNNGNLFVPNTFSPNGDGINDRFFPSGKGINMIKLLRVYNRWGEVVFERGNFNANDATVGWDGKYKGQVLAPDVYVYSCDVVCQNNEVLNFKGDVTLLR
jgi:gliding motility-associated-like protein